MGVDWLGGGFVVALAAALWLAYLLPSWFRRNEYMATEKNAVRLQQTLRILAETSEVPEEVRIEANARSVVEQQKRLKKVIMDSTPAALIQAAKIKRSRALASALLLVAVIVTVLGAMQIALTGAWLVMLAGALVSVACVLRLAKLAKMGRMLRLLLEAVESERQRVAQAFADHGAEFDEATEAEETESAEWTPVEIPRPLYLTRRAPVSAPAPALQSVEDDAEADALADRLRAASLRAQEALRHAAIAEAESSHAGSPVGGSMPTVAAPPRVEESARPERTAPRQPSRYASMGVVDETATGTLNLDEVMARRRAV